MTARKRRYLLYIAQNYAYAICRPLQEEILAQGGEVTWFLEGDEVNPDYLRENEIRLNTIEKVKQFNPDVVLVPGNVVPRFIPGLKVDIFHGFNSGKRVRRGKARHFEIRNCFDLYCTQGPQTTGPFQELALEHRHFSVKETGWSMLDPLFKVNHDNPYIDKSDTRPTVLMCSTFSRNLTCAPHLYEQVKAMSKKGNWRWLVQFHPKMPEDVVEKYKQLQNDNLTFVETDNVIPLLKAADVMLCDTSSVLLMFLLQRKPVVTFKNRAPQPHLLDISQADKVEESIQLALSKPSDLMEEIEKYCQFIHPYTDGESSRRVLKAVDKMLDNGKQLSLKRKPFNLIRELKLRKKIGYWKPW
ncbi:CDP-glycerol glycerophosphotransferase family protein [Vibrio sp. TH_r3]|uniref:CDP-glycerol glycerophosphotransferase family protein n=1 Tax=Vibrio sp. TH_r3 TaxID=3082084 RepID=UPI002954B2EA|nr:CDP-glycerol glycerophosphotransferase family protein [Vibrio sp. TH_r3]MDV7104196.1 CDP-glycerol glycerophosphotransferase family protein [Vibrio sp. TH_r3]